MLFDKAVLAAMVDGAERAIATIYDTPGVSDVIFWYNGQGFRATCNWDDNTCPTFWLCKVTDNEISNVTPKG